jgi:hypothetical protein
MESRSGVGVRGWGVGGEGGFGGGGYFAAYIHEVVARHEIRCQAQASDIT